MTCKILKTTFLGFIYCCSTVLSHLQAQDTAALYHEKWRPQIHFSPKAHWMNDPNGMVFNQDIYHLFFQYYPNATVWGPMHWGHAESKDMIHWQQKPVALYPDKLGYIFSGSAVVDANNTSGFGKNGKIPLVAIFTNHDPNGEKAGKNNYQNESIAYSLDNGSSWTKYSGNPVLKNPGIKDFRDPKVMWYAPKHEWLMTLATKDRITFFSSPNLKSWKKESEFGQHLGAHGGVWECPDLFPLTLNGKTYWVLLVSINPGGPNGGSATQYFIGQFNGTSFIAQNTETKWIDYGPDDYAGVTWGNTGNQRIFLGWMSNWLYGPQVPTVKWRSAMTIPRKLGLKEVNGKIFLTSEPVKELAVIANKAEVIGAIKVINNTDINKKLGTLPGQFILKMSTQQLNDYQIILSNSAGEKLIIGYDQKSNRYYINRSAAGKHSFNKDFAAVHYAPRISAVKSADLTLVVDVASAELFADNGLSVMTSIFFPAQPYTTLQLQSPGINLDDFKLIPLQSIWK